MKVKSCQIKEKWFISKACGLWKRVDKLGQTLSKDPGS